ncbi:MAG: hypothetical protein GKR87_00615 [Kiritimatiellae bacterium]|nr:hypothetical protein [Kiritimatiellia bacterium]
MPDQSAVENPIKITGEFTPDPDVCKFIIDRPILDGWTLIFKDKDQSMGSPLVDALFEIEGITEVKVTGSTVTITKNISIPWPDMGNDILPAIRHVLTHNKSAISQEAIEAVEQAATEDIGSVIEQLFEVHINPALASHGGYVRLLEVQDRDVYLEMGGGCQGCAASQATLRDGIETAIREVVPQVRQVIDATDHSSGANPYYS